MDKLRQHLSQNFSLPLFLQGSGIGIVLIGLVFFWISNNGPSIIDEHFAELETAQADIDWSAVPEEELAKALNEKGVSLAVQKQALADVETETFQKNSPHGPLPTKSREGKTPFEVFKRPYIPEPTEVDFPRISLLILDYCLSAKNSRLVLDSLPSNVSLSISPYCTSPQEASAKARSAGHELWLSIPMETEGYPIDDYGPLSLLVNKSAEANKTKLQKLLTRTAQYVGIVTYLQPVYTRSESDFTPVLDFLTQSGLGLLETNLRPEKYIENYAIASKLPYTNASVIIDEELNEFALKARLSELERIANERGQAVGVMHAVPLTVNTVSEWVFGLSDKQISLVPLSAQAGY